MGEIERLMRDKLAAAFNPERLDVINESHLHAGHQEKFDGSGETHFRVQIVSAEFANKNRVQRHRLVNDVVAEELKDSVHALAVQVAAPGEAVRW
ncbi:MAG: BolA family protein [Pseudomonadota bacterium]